MAEPVWIGSQEEEEETRDPISLDVTRPVEGYFSSDPMPIGSQSSISHSVDIFQHMLGKGGETLFGEGGMWSDLADQEKDFEKYKAQFGGRFSESDNQLGWLGERMAENVTGTAVPYAGYSLAAISAFVPGIGVVLAPLIAGGTWGVNYLQNLGDTVSDFEDANARQGKKRKITEEQRQKAALTAVGVTVLDMIPGKKGTKPFDDLVKQGIARKDIDKLVEIAKGNPDKIFNQISKGTKFIAKGGVREGVTESAQKGLQLGVSDPEYAVSPEGLEDIGVEGLIGTGMGTTMTTPPAIAEATSTNRQINKAIKSLENENTRRNIDRITKSVGASYVGEPMIDVPQTASVFPDSLKARIKPVGDYIKGMAGDIGELAGYKSITSVKKKADELEEKGAYQAANTLRTVIAMFEAPETLSGEQKIGDTFHSLRNIFAGNLLEDVYNSLDEITDQKFGMGEMGATLDKQINDFIIDTLRGKEVDNDTILKELSAKGHDPAKVVNAIESIVNSIQKAKRYALEPLDESQVIEIDPSGGIDQVFNVEKLRNPKIKDQFVDWLMQEKKLDSVEAQIIYDDIMANQGVNIPKNPLSKRQIQYRNPKNPNRDWAKARRFNSVPEEFLENNVQRLIENYLFNVAKSTAAAQVFGANDANILDDFLKQAQDQAGEFGGIGSETIKKVWDMYDASLGFYKPIQSTSGRQLNRLNLTIQAMSHLGLATISSLSEVAWIIERFGLSGFIGGLPIAATYAAKGISRSIIKTASNTGKFGKPDGKVVLQRVGYGLQSSMNERMAQMYAGDFSPALDMWFRSPFGAFLTHWTNFNRVWAAGAGQVMLNNWANDWSTMSKTQQRNVVQSLKELGISERTFHEIVKLDYDFNLANDEFVDIELNTAGTLADGSQKTVRHVLAPALQQMIDDVVVHPRATNKPLWMSDPHMAMFSQLKSFPIVFGNTVMKRVLKKINAGTTQIRQGNIKCPAVGQAVGAIGAMATALAIASVANLLKDVIKGKPPEVTLFEAGEQAGIDGAFSFATGMITGARYGNMAESLAGPTVGTFNDIGQRGVMEEVWSNMQKSLGAYGINLEAQE